MAAHTATSEHDDGKKKPKEEKKEGGMKISPLMWAVIILAVLLAFSTGMVQVPILSGGMERLSHHSDSSDSDRSDSNLIAPHHDNVIVDTKNSAPPNSYDCYYHGQKGKCHDN